MYVHIIRHNIVNLFLFYIISQILLLYLFIYLLSIIQWQFWV
jgi:hypothetical protein